MKRIWPLQAPQNIALCPSTLHGSINHHEVILKGKDYPSKGPQCTHVIQSTTQTVGHGQESTNYSPKVIPNHPYVPKVCIPNPKGSTCVKKVKKLPPYSTNAMPSKCDEWSFK